MSDQQAGRLRRLWQRLGARGATGAGLLVLVGALLVGALGLGLGRAGPVDPPSLGPVVDLDDRPAARTVPGTSPAPTTSPGTSTSRPSATARPSASARPPATSVRRVTPKPTRIPYTPRGDDDDDDDRFDDDRDDWDDD